MSQSKQGTSTVHTIALIILGTTTIFYACVNELVDWELTNKLGQSKILNVKMLPFCNVSYTKSILMSAQANRLTRFHYIICSAIIWIMQNVWFNIKVMSFSKVHDMKLQVPTASLNWQLKLLLKRKLLREIVSFINVKKALPYLSMYA